MYYDAFMTCIGGDLERVVSRSGSNTEANENSKANIADELIDQPYPEMSCGS